MSRRRELTHQFVDDIPDELEDGVLYISIPYATAVHRCMCGCGNEAVTPLSPQQWSMAFNGKTVSLCPSVGNWSFACQSHYWIKNDTVDWAAKWDRDKIAAGRKRRSDNIERAYNGDADPNTPAAPPGWFKRLLAWFRWER